MSSEEQNPRPFESTSWRLIRHQPFPGALNMAVDEAILEAVGRGEVLPTLRLYAWQPPCLSLGYAQPLSDVDLDALKANGWELVRRPTGGRAILHTDELTYSVIGPENEPRLAGGVLKSYANLARALLRGLELLAVPARAVESTGGTMPNGSTPGIPKIVNPVCFEVPSNYEITVSGKKLIGSAQARRKEGVLQHGSLPLFGDLTRITWALNFPDRAARQNAADRLLSRAATIESAIGFRLDWDQAAEALASAFRETLNLVLVPQDLTPAEQERAQALAEHKFRSMAWTGKI